MKFNMCTLKTNTVLEKLTQEIHIKNNAVLRQIT